MANRVISTVDAIQNTVTTGKDRNMEISNSDFPLKEVDQSKTISTHNLIPNKRSLEKKDITKMVDQIKGTQKT